MNCPVNKILPKQYATLATAGLKFVATTARFFPWVVATASTAVASPLGDAAAAMSPGTFVELSTEGLSRDMMTQNGCGSPITSYTDNAVWDPQSRRFLFVGGPHGCPHAFIEYRESDNTWANLEPLAEAATHAYDHTTIDAVSRTVYFRKHSGGGFHSYNLISANWTLDALPTPPSSFTQVSGGLEFFPPLNRLMHINYGGAGEVDIFENDAWSRVDSVSMGERAGFIEYNPVHEVVLFGGGVRGSDPTVVSREMYAMDASRNILSKADAPIGLAITKSIVTVDPVSGKYLVFGNGGYFYEYDVISDAWRNRSGSVPFLETVYDENSEVFGTVAAPLSTHGVVLFLQYLGSGSKVWLYKHQDSGPPDLTPPGIPADLAGSGISDSGTSLTWTPAVDPESGVFSYDVYRDDVLTGNTVATSFTDSGLADATAYHYQVAAVNGSGIVGSRSPSTVVSTLADVERPTVLSAEAFGDTGVVAVRFSEAVDQSTALSAANYAINAGVTVYGAQAGIDDQSVLLSTSSLSPATTYTLTISGVTDQANTPNWIMAGSQVNFEFVPSVAGHNTLPDNYTWGRLREGGHTYVDRSYYFTDIPADYDGLDYLQTANDDKGGAGAAFISFDLPEAATVYVGFDVRATTMPDWLSGWFATGNVLQTSDTGFNLYSRQYASGPVILGGNEGSSPSMYTVVVEPATGGPVNSLPQADGDAASTSQGTAVGIDLLANDSGLNDVPITLSVDSAPSHGTIDIFANRIVAYYPNPGFSGSDRLTYRITDADGDASTATVLIKVSATGRDATPVAVNDVAVTPRNVAVTVNVLANDAGLADTPVVLSLVSQPAHGSASVIGEQQIRYTPSPASTGIDALSYQVVDADGDTSQATVTVVVFGDM